MKTKRNKCFNEKRDTATNLPSITDAYNTIAESFDFGSVQYYRSFIKKLCEHTSRNKVYGKHDPSGIVFTLERLDSLLFAANIVNEAKINTCLIIEDNEILNKKYYSRSRSEIEDWESFPRMLSIDEFKNPYLVFRKLFKQQDLATWKITINELLHCALSRNPFQLEFDMLATYIYLTKLVEAASLINLREIIHINGKMKGR